MLQLRLVRMLAPLNPPAQRVNLCESHQAYAACSLMLQFDADTGVSSFHRPPPPPQLPPRAFPPLFDFEAAAAVLVT